jgi:hypothetical protein
MKTGLLISEAVEALPSATRFLRLATKEGLVISYRVQLDNVASLSGGYIPLVDFGC